MESITTKYKVAKATIKRVEDFKKFVGEDAFNNILQGISVVDIPLEQEKFKELMSIVLDEDDKIDTLSLCITYDEAEEILSFFCEPFAGKRLKQVKSTLDTISSMLNKVDPALMRMAMGSGSSRIPTTPSTNAVNSQTETSKEAPTITLASHSQT